MKITAQTEAVSSPPEEKWHWSQQWRQNTFRAGQKLKADWKKDLHNLGAGRKSRKPPTPFVGMKPHGKCQLKQGSGKHPTVRWTSYDARLKQYQGELEGKEEYTRVFLKLADRNSNYDFSKLEYLWSHLLKCCTSGSPV